jgi:hypothetical protein
MRRQHWQLQTKRQRVLRERRREDGDGDIGRLARFVRAKSNYDITHSMTKWVERLIICIAAVTAIVLVADSIVSIASGVYLNLGSGVWLALARDTHDGVFYRPLWNGSEYGGTRYFPMLFVLAAGLMRMGLDAVPAGVTISVAGLAAMGAAVALFLKRLGISRALVIAGTALSVAPYFVHQTAFAIRCEPIAAAFAIFGLAAITPIESRTNSTRHLVLAAALFVAAFISKVTCVYAPAAVTVALLLGGRRGAALKLAIITATGAILLLAVINVISDGRAIESFRACALAGSSVLSLFSPAAVTRAIQLIGTSHLLTVVFLLTIATLVIRPSAWLTVPRLYLVATAVITAIIFTSPGTILTSQIVDAYVASIVVLTTAVAAQRGQARQLGALVLVAFGVWTAGQNLARVAGMVRDGAVRTGIEARQQLVAGVDKCGGTIVSESPMIPIFAGQRPVVLDPFALHVVSLNRPEIERHLVERIRRQEFACVVLEQDPSTPKGQAWYSNVNLTKDVMDAVLQHYRLERTIADERFFRAVQ